MKMMRLFTQFQPSNYTLHIAHDRVGKKFTGQVTIKGALVGESNLITLHAKDLTIAKATIDNVVAQTSRGDNDELHVKAAAVLAPGAHVVQLEFSGDITDPMHGLYPCYFEDKGVKKELLATQFESHHAREVFPCIDEPEAKATFDLSLSTETGVTTLANTPVATQEEVDGKLVTTFKTTPKMSVYLLAWVVGELQSKTAKTKNGVEVGVWATPVQNPETLDFALDVAVKSIEFYNDYFDLPYPLAKCDLVALPDFSSGAMENWGCVTFREVCLLVDPVNTSIPAKQSVAMVIAHELAHQWFGNLVTMRWWDDLWLNESFASMMEFVTLDALFPSWKIWLDFSTQDTISALRRDRLKGVQAVRTGVNHPDEINTLFDPSIVYAKGAKLMQMAYHYVGDAAWRKGLHDYFVAHQYGNTEAQDLWQALSAASGKDIAGLMTPWLERPGYPLLTIASAGDNQYDISQQRFLSNPVDRQQDTSDPWPVPLLANVSITPNVLTERSAKVTAERADDMPLKFNSQDRALFVTHYADAAHRAKLKQAVADNKFNEVDRLQLLHELTLLSSAGVVSQRDVLDVLEAYRQEQTEAVWEMMAVAIGDTRKLIESDEPATKLLRQYVAVLIEPQFKRLGWDKKPGESDFDTMLRGLILGSGVFAEYAPIVDEAKKRFTAFTKPEDLPADLRDVIYSAAIKCGGQAEFDKLLDLYNKTTFAEERATISSGLTATKNPQHISYLLDKLKDTNFVRTQDFPRWFAYLMRNRYSRAAMWQWLTTEWDGWVTQQFASDKSYDAFPRYAAATMCQPEEFEQYKAFFMPKIDEPALRRAIEVGCKDIQSRVLWRERDFAAIVDYLQKA